MSQHNFQLAYTIKPRHRDDENDAAQARLHLREHLGWDTVEHIETTLLGMVPLYHSTTRDRVNEAEKYVRERIHQELKDLRVLTKVRFHGCLMVDGLGQAIRFSIEP